MQAVDPQSGSLEAANSNEWDSVPLKAFPLHDFNYRRAFLFQVYWRGEDCLFEAVSHVWNSLKPPKNYSAACITNAAGFSGATKAALMQMLKAFIQDGVATIRLIPSPDDFTSLEEWNESIKQDSAREQADLDRILDQWTCLLNAQKQPSYD
jgi:hypothetical protein